MPAARCSAAALAARSACCCYRTLPLLPRAATNACRAARRAALWPYCCRCALLLPRAAAALPGTPMSEKKHPVRWRRNLQYFYFSIFNILYLQFQYLSSQF
jgi:hypothetical protein